MGLNTVIKETSLDIMQVVKRPPEVYPVAASKKLFTIVGGPVWIKGLFFYANEAVDAAGGGTTMLMKICGVAADNGATVIATPIGGNCVWPLQNGNPPVPGVLSNPMPTLAAAGAGSFGQLVSPGGAGGDNIVVTVAAASTVGKCSFYVLYFRMDSDAKIVVAA